MASAGSCRARPARPRNWPLASASFRRSRKTGPPNLVDTAFFSDPDDAKSDLVDAMIGELSNFHNEFGYYPQGVSVNTGVFPPGWEDRLITYETPSTAPGRGLCLEPHDCVLAKLVRFEEKDRDFAAALVREGLIDLDILNDRVETLPAPPAFIERIRNWIDAMRARQPLKGSEP